MLQGGLITHVDDADYDKVSYLKWYAVHTRGLTYVRMVGKPTVYLHRMIMNPRIGMDTDHIDGNGLNNTRENLRVVTHRENLNNSHRIVKKQSEYPGVCWHAHHKKWVARIYIKSEGKQVHIGYFSTEEEAYAAYKERSDALLH